MLDPGCWTLDAGFWKLDMRLWTLDTELWALDAALWTVGSGHWTLLLIGSEQTRNPVSDSAWLNYLEVFGFESL